MSFVCLMIISLIDCFLTWNFRHSKIQVAWRSSCLFPPEMPYQETFPSSCTSRFSPIPDPDWGYCLLAWHFWASAVRPWEKYQLFNVDVCDSGRTTLPLPLILSFLITRPASEHLVKTKNLESFISPQCRDKKSFPERFMPRLFAISHLLCRPQSSSIPGLYLKLARD
ncbi:hypothetical protein DL96DRAFT_1608036 [Flagelloscypha sp. PMI_526]|nr:hypothetical protein DL96DRAFT_1608036 [Flagelloscypha sp. PMI_526]